VRWFLFSAAILINFLCEFFSISENFRSVFHSSFYCPAFTKTCLIVFRLNPDLGDFVATIYSRAFQPQKEQTRLIATRLKSIGDKIDINSVAAENDVLRKAQEFLLALSDAMMRKSPTLLKSPSHIRGIIPEYEKDISDAAPGLPPHPISLALIRLKTRSARPEQVAYEVHVRGEAALAAALVKTIRACSPEDDIFVVTPHRIQRQAVKEALGHGQDEDLADVMKRMSISGGLEKVRVDTVERLQGKMNSASLS
jgi:hypothetical protein